MIQRFLIMAVLWFRSFACRSFVLAAWLAIIVLSLSVLSRITNSRPRNKPDDGQTVRLSREQVGSLSPRSNTFAGWHEEDVEDLAISQTSTKPSHLNRQINHLPTTGDHEYLAEYAVRVAAEGKRHEILELFTAIENASPEYQDILARGLQALHASDIGPDLLAFLVRNAENNVVAVQARDALARTVAPEYIEQVSQAVPSAPEQEILRAYLIQALSQISNPAAVDSLMDLCALSKDPDISAAGARALGSIGTPEAVTSLVVLIQDRGLEDLNDPLSQALMSAANKDSRMLLQDEFLHATNPVVRYATAYALAAQSIQTMRLSNSLKPNQNDTLFPLGHE